MDGIEEMNLGIRIVASECLRSSRHKERIIFSPDRQQRWTSFAEKSLKLRIERDVTCIVQKQIELYFVVPPDMPAKRIAEWDAIRDEIGRAIGGDESHRWLTIMFTSDPEWAE